MAFPGVSLIDGRFFSAQYFHTTEVIQLSFSKVLRLAPAIITWLAGLFFLSSLPLTAADLMPIAANPPIPSGFAIHRGVNISHWLSQSRERGEKRRARFTQEDVRRVADLGFDHVRLPIDEVQMWDESGSPDPEAFALLEEGLKWCAEAGLKAVVDLHILRSHYFYGTERPLWTDSSAQDRFVKCWEDLSDALRHHPTNLLAYELLNEPVAPDPEQWNALLARAHAAIRAREPSRTLVIGSNKFQSTETFDHLRVPENDPNIYLSFHFYEPFHLTHYRARWVPFGDYSGPVKYPGPTVEPTDLEGLPEDLRTQMESATKSWDRARIEECLAKPLALAARTGLPLYCGEWGCYKEVPRPTRLAWYRDVVSVLATHGIAWAVWGYKGSFPLVVDDKTDMELAEILTKTP